MATVRKPIALNETFKTTESTPRNLADVLAQALQALNTTISGLNFINCVVVQALPTADISTTTIYLVPKNPAQTDNLYDEYINLTGTSAGWEKIGDTEIDLSDYYNKTETDTLLGGKVDKVNGKGLSTNDYTTAEKTKLAGIEAGAEVNPTSSAKTATESFETVDGGLLSKCQINLVPVQSGSGDPYPAGGGKNKLDTKTTTDGTRTWTQDSDGYITQSPNNSDGRIWGYSNTQYKSSLLAGSYKFVYEIKTTLSDGGTGIRIYDDNNVEISGVFNPFINTGIQTIDFTLSATTNIGVMIKQYSAVVRYMIVKSTESTTFEPYSNVRPISGHTEVDLYNVGKNLLSGIEDGGINDYGTTESSPIRCRSIDYIPVKPNTQYTFKALASGGVLQYIIRTFYDNNNTYKESDNGGWHSGAYSFTTSNDVHFVKIIFSYTSHTAISASNIYDAQLEQGSTATPYEPYLGHLYQVQIGSTVYGGYVDLVSGVMVCDRGFYTINGTEGKSWYLYNEPTYLNVYANITDIIPDVKLVSNYDYLNDVVFNIFKSIIWSSARTVSTAYIQSGWLNMQFELGKFSNSSDVNTWLGSNNLQVVYPLATPQTIQLTPQEIETLAGQNNLSTPLSGQSIETNGVEYKELFTFADVKEYVKPLIPYSNAGSHNAIYRGKYLGNHVTPEQWASIVAGTFDDLFIGDYWTINGVNWRIAHFDYWLGTGNVECTDHNVAIVPDSNLYNSKMNSSNVTTGGYYNSLMRGGANYLVSGSSNLYQASEDIKSAFGSSHILTHKEMLTNAISSGNASGWAWYDSSVDLMNEVMVYGTLAWSIGGKGYEVGIDKGQFALFRHDVSKVTIRADWWLRGVASSENFTRVCTEGFVRDYYAGSSLGVRPCFAIK